MATSDHEPQAKVVLPKKSIEAVCQNTWVELFCSVSGFFGQWDALSCSLWDSVSRLRVRPILLSVHETHEFRRLDFARAGRQLRRQSRCPDRHSDEVFVSEVNGLNVTGLVPPCVLI